MFTARYGLIAYIKQVFITVLESVYSAVRTDCLYKAGFYKPGRKCVQRVRSDCLYKAGFYKRGRNVYSAVRTDSLYKVSFYNCC